MPINSVDWVDQIVDTTAPVEATDHLSDLTASDHDILTRAIRKENDYTFGAVLIYGLFIHELCPLQVQYKPRLRLVSLVPSVPATFLVNIGVVVSAGFIPTWYLGRCFGVNAGQRMIQRKYRASEGRTEWAFRKQQAAGLRARQGVTERVARLEGRVVLGRRERFLLYWNGLEDYNERMKQEKRRAGK